MIFMNALFCHREKNQQYCTVIMVSRSTVYCRCELVGRIVVSPYSAIKARIDIHNLANDSSDDVIERCNRVANGNRS